jgi:hypothetical protein
LDLGTYIIVAEILLLLSCAEQCFAAVGLIW